MNRFSPQYRVAAGLLAGSMLAFAGACGGGDDSTTAADTQAPSTATTEQPRSDSRPVDREEAAQRLAAAFDLTQEQAQCGIDRLDDRVVAAFVDAGFDLDQMEEGDAAVVYEAGLACVGPPQGG